MAKVGDVILKARVAMNDLPATIGAPPLLTLTPIADASSTLLPGTYAVVVTQFNSWGESNPTASQNVVVAAGQGFVVGGPLAFAAWQAVHAYALGAVVVPTTANGHAYICVVAGNSAAAEPSAWPTASGLTINDGTVVWKEYGPSMPAGIAKYRVYFGIGSPTAWMDATSLPVLVETPGTAGNPPTRSSAYNPDADAPQVSAAVLFGWLTDGLKIAARLVNGIKDYTGVGSVNGAPMYTLTGQWSKIQQIWFDGYPVNMANKRSFFMRSGVNAIPWGFDAAMIADRQILESYPHANRTAGATTLSGGMLTTDTTGQCLDLSSFVLPFGLASIGTEIVQYSAFAANQFTGLIRGLGGTKQQAWPIGTAVVELNIRIAGLRLHTQDYAPGDASVTLPVPVGWESILSDFILARFRESEGERVQASSLDREFRGKLLEWGTANRVPGPCQIQGPGERDVYFPRLGGGVIVN